MEGNEIEKRRKRKINMVVNVPAPMNQTILTDIRDLILLARRRAAQKVNAELTMIYWHIGRRIRQDILEEKRMVYGKEILTALGRQLEFVFGRGFG